MSNNISPQHRLDRLNQTGLVSIIVTMIMIIVISLIVLGFSEVTRRNQTETLDRQLSSQAYYAAETGVNDVIAKLKDPAAHFAPADATKCDQFTGDNSMTTGLVGNVSYTCALVTEAVPSIKLSVAPGISKTTVINMTDASDLVISWNAKGAGANTCVPSAGVGTFTPSGTYTDPTSGCPYALVRLDVYNGASPGDPDVMANGTESFYFQPTNNTGIPRVSFSPSAATPGLVIGAGCTPNTSATTGTCTVKLSGVPAGTSGTPPGTNSYARLTSVYWPADVTISGSTFSGSQALIDVTGKAQDVLKRIQVRVPLGGGGEVPTDAVQSTDGICKRFTTLGSGHNANDGNDTNIPAELCSAP
jgi:hypothetical protein